MVPFVLNFIRQFCSHHPDRLPCTVDDRLSEPADPLVSSVSRLGGATDTLARLVTGALGQELGADDGCRGDRRRWRPYRLAKPSLPLCAAM